MEGEPGERRFCGVKSKPGSSWCPEHHRICHKNTPAKGGPKPWTEAMLTTLRPVACAGRLPPRSVLVKPRRGARRRRSVSLRGVRTQPRNDGRHLEGGLGWHLPFAHLPRQISLPRKGRRVGLHIALFFWFIIDFRERLRGQRLIRSLSDLQEFDSEWRVGRCPRLILRRCLATGKGST